VIIEKIGDIHFMFNWYRWSKIACDANYSNGLRCYQEAELGLYSTEIVDSCDYYYKWVGVDEIDNIKTFKIFPNPSNGQFQIDVEPDKNKTIEISNLKGEIIYSKAYNSKTVDMTGYLKGIYVVRLKSGEKTVGIGRIILEGK
jgi:hypothetical protein